ncbi:hypothetical protein B5F10_14885 [Anaerotruncus colihominis]|uniref:Uncharacterized protein n=1 Tax=Anaerotruncus colihominis TaxID=169435 RepID=A0A1Y4MZP4_9FIRM|nr:hypothetical protein B5F11_14835 [Anaerotruncus colihominis]OUP72392.1 hypothetical protein B5F10_14885 [Anaerotruncus colihominis]RGE65743.1 hypothetical protein DXC40_15950 [Anaerotruncus colihominis]
MFFTSLLARAIRARIAHRRPLCLPGRLFGAFRRYSAGRGQAAAAPLFAPHKGRVGDPPLMLSPPLLGTDFSGARRCVL